MIDTSEAKIALQQYLISQKQKVEQVEAKDRSRKKEDALVKTGNLTQRNNTGSIRSAANPELHESMALTKTTAKFDPKPRSGRRTIAAAPGAGGVAGDATGLVTGTGPPKIGGTTQEKLRRKQERYLQNSWDSTEDPTRIPLSPRSRSSLHRQLSHFVRWKPVSKNYQQSVKELSHYRNCIISEPPMDCGLAGFAYGNNREIYIVNKSTKVATEAQKRIQDRHRDRHEAADGSFASANTYSATASFANAQHDGEDVSFYDRSGLLGESTLAATSAFSSFRSNMSATQKQCLPNEDEIILVENVSTRQNVIDYLAAKKARRETIASELARAMTLREQAARDAAEIAHREQDRERAKAVEARAKASLGKATKGEGRNGGTTTSRLPNDSRITPSKLRTDAVSVDKGSVEGNDFFKDGEHKSYPTRKGKHKKVGKVIPCYSYQSHPSFLFYDEPDGERNYSTRAPSVRVRDPSQMEMGKTQSTKSQLTVDRATPLGVSKTLSTTSQGKLDVSKSLSTGPKRGLVPQIMAHTPSISEGKRAVTNNGNQGGNQVSSRIQGSSKLQSNLTAGPLSLSLSSSNPNVPVLSPDGITGNGSTDQAIPHFRFRKFEEPFSEDRARYFKNIGVKPGPRKEIIPEDDLRWASEKYSEAIKNLGVVDSVRGDRIERTISNSGRKGRGGLSREDLSTTRVSLKSGLASNADFGRSTNKDIVNSNVDSRPSGGMSGLGKSASAGSILSSSIRKSSNTKKKCIPRKSITSSLGSVDEHDYYHLSSSDDGRSDEIRATALLDDDYLNPSNFPKAGGIDINGNLIPLEKRSTFWLTQNFSEQSRQTFLNRFATLPFPNAEFRSSRDHEKLSDFYTRKIALKRLRENMLERQGEFAAEKKAKLEELRRHEQVTPEAEFFLSKLMWPIDLERPPYNLSRDTPQYIFAKQGLHTPFPSLPILDKVFLPMPTTSFFMDNKRRADVVGKFEKQHKMFGGTRHRDHDNHNAYGNHDDNHSTKHSHHSGDGRHHEKKDHLLELEENLLDREAPTGLTKKEEAQEKEDRKRIMQDADLQFLRRKICRMFYQKAHVDRMLDKQLDRCTTRLAESYMQIRQGVWRERFQSSLVRSFAQLLDCLRNSEQELDALDQVAKIEETNRKKLGLDDESIMIANQKNKELVSNFRGDEKNDYEYDDIESSAGMSARSNMSSSTSRGDISMSMRSGMSSRGATAMSMRDGEYEINRSKPISAAAIGKSISAAAIATSDEAAEGPSRSFATNTTGKSVAANAIGKSGAGFVNGFAKSSQELAGPEAGGGVQGGKPGDAPAVAKMMRSKVTDRRIQNVSRTMDVAHRNKRRMSDIVKKIELGAKKRMKQGLGRVAHLLDKFMTTGPKKTATSNHHGSGQHGEGSPQGSPTQTAKTPGAAPKSVTLNANDPKDVVIESVSKQEEDDLLWLYKQKEEVMAAKQHFDRKSDVYLAENCRYIYEIFCEEKLAKNLLEVVTCGYKEFEVNRILEDEFRKFANEIRESEQRIMKITEQRQEEALKKAKKMERARVKKINFEKASFLLQEQLAIENKRQEKLYLTDAKNLHSKVNYDAIIELLAATNPEFQRILDCMLGRNEQDNLDSKKPCERGRRAGSDASSYVGTDPGRSDDSNSDAKSAEDSVYGDKKKNFLRPLADGTFLETEKSEGEEEEVLDFTTGEYVKKLTKNIRIKELEDGTMKEDFDRVYYERDQETGKVTMKRKRHFRRKENGENGKYAGIFEEILGGYLRPIPGKPKFYQEVLDQTSSEEEDFSSIDGGKITKRGHIHVRKLSDGSYEECLGYVAEIEEEVKLTDQFGHKTIITRLIPRKPLKFTRHPNGIYEIFKDGQLSDDEEKWEIGENGIRYKSRKVKKRQYLKQAPDGQFDECEESSTEIEVEIEVEELDLCTGKPTGKKIRTGEFHKIKKDNIEFRRLADGVLVQVDPVKDGEFERDAKGQLLRSKQGETIKHRKQHRHFRRKINGRYEEIMPTYLRSREDGTYEEIDAVSSEEEDEDGKMKKKRHIHFRKCNDGTFIEVDDAFHHDRGHNRPPLRRFKKKGKLFVIMEPITEAQEKAMQRIKDYRIAQAEKEKEWAFLEMEDSITERDGLESTDSITESEGLGTSVLDGKGKKTKKSSKLPFPMTEELPDFVEVTLPFVPANDNKANNIDPVTPSKEKGFGKFGVDNTLYANVDGKGNHLIDNSERDRMNKYFDEGLDYMKTRGMMIMQERTRKGRGKIGRILENGFAGRILEKVEDGTPGKRGKGKGKWNPMVPKIVEKGKGNFTNLPVKMLRKRRRKRIVVGYEEGFGQDNNGKPMNGKEIVEYGKWEFIPDSAPGDKPIRLDRNEHASDFEYETVEVFNMGLWDRKAWAYDEKGNQGWYDPFETNGRIQFHHKNEWREEWNHEWENAITELEEVFANGGTISDWVLQPEPSIFDAIPFEDALSSSQKSRIEDLYGDDVEIGDDGYAIFRNDHVLKPNGQLDLETAYKEHHARKEKHRKARLRKKKMETEEAKRKRKLMEEEEKVRAIAIYEQMKTAGMIKSASPDSNMSYSSYSESRSDIEDSYSEEFIQEVDDISEEEVELLDANGRVVFDGEANDFMTSKMMNIELLPDAADGREMIPSSRPGSTMSGSPSGNNKSKGEGEGGLLLVGADGTGGLDDTGENKILQRRGIVLQKRKSFSSKTAEPDATPVVKRRKVKKIHYHGRKNRDERLRADGINPIMTPCRQRRIRTARDRKGNDLVEDRLLNAIKYEEEKQRKLQAEREEELAKLKKPLQSLGKKKKKLEKVLSPEERKEEEKKRMMKELHALRQKAMAFADNAKVLSKRDQQRLRELEGTGGFDNKPFIPAKRTGGAYTTVWNTIENEVSVTTTKDAINGIGGRKEEMRERSRRINLFGEYRKGYYMMDVDQRIEQRARENREKLLKARLGLDQIPYERPPFIMVPMLTRKGKEPPIMQRMRVPDCLRYGVRLAVKEEYSIMAPVLSWMRDEDRVVEWERIVGMILDEENDITEILYDEMAPPEERARIVEKYLINHRVNLHDKPDIFDELQRFRIKLLRKRKVNLFAETLSSASKRGKTDLPKSPNLMAMNSKSVASRMVTQSYREREREQEKNTNANLVDANGNPIPLTPQQSAEKAMQERLTSERAKAVAILSGRDLRAEAEAKARKQREAELITDPIVKVDLKKEEDRLKEEKAERDKTKVKPPGKVFNPPRWDAPLQKPDRKKPSKTSIKTRSDSPEVIDVLGGSGGYVSDYYSDPQSRGGSAHTGGSVNGSSAYSGTCGYFSDPQIPTQSEPQTRPSRRTEPKPEEDIETLGKFDIRDAFGLRMNHDRYAHYIQPAPQFKDIQYQKVVGDWKRQYYAHSVKDMTVTTGLEGGDERCRRLKREEREKQILLSESEASSSAFSSDAISGPFGKGNAERDSGSRSHPGKKARQDSESIWKEKEYRKRITKDLRKNALIKEKSKDITEPDFSTTHDPLTFSRFDRLAAFGAIIWKDRLVTRNKDINRGKSVFLPEPYNNSVLLSADVPHLFNGNVKNWKRRRSHVYGGEDPPIENKELMKWLDQRKATTRAKRLSIGDSKEAGAASIAESLDGSTMESPTSPQKVAKNKKGDIPYDKPTVPSRSLTRDGYDYKDLPQVWDLPTKEGLFIKNELERHLKKPRLDPPYSGRPIPSKIEVENYRKNKKKKQDLDQPIDLD